MTYTIMKTAPRRNDVILPQAAPCPSSPTKWQGYRKEDFEEQITEESKVPARQKEMLPPNTQKKPKQHTPKAKVKAGDQGTFTQIRKSDAPYEAKKKKRTPQSDIKTNPLSQEHNWIAEPCGRLDDNKGH